MILLLVEIAAFILWVALPVYAYRLGKRRGIARKWTRRAGWFFLVLSVLGAAGSQMGSSAVPRVGFSAEWWGSVSGLFLWISIADALLLRSVLLTKGRKAV